MPSQNPQLQQEMEQARAMQRAALPLQPPRTPGFDIAAVSEAAGAVSGDFHLFLAPVRTEKASQTEMVAGSRFGLAVGDVSGKGIPAALAATSIGHLFPWLSPLRDPERALADLNQDLFRCLPPEVFTSLIYAEIDPENQRLRLWAAGHPPALLWRSQQGDVLQSRCGNLPLGCFPDWEGAPEEWQMAPGDVLVLYSDGLSEARDSCGEPFGGERLAEVLADLGGESAERIAQGLLDAARAWGRLADDVTIVVCKNTTVPTRSRAGIAVPIPPGVAVTVADACRFRRAPNNSKMGRSRGAALPSVLISAERH